MVAQQKQEFYGYFQNLLGFGEKVVPMNSSQENSALETWNQSHENAYQYGKTYYNQTGNPQKQSYTPQGSLVPIYQAPISQIDLSRYAPPRQTYFDYFKNFLWDSKVCLLN